MLHTLSYSQTFKLWTYHGVVLLYCSYISYFNCQKFYCKVLILLLLLLMMLFTAVVISFEQLLYTVEEESGMATIQLRKEGVNERDVSVVVALDDAGSEAMGKSGYT